MCPVASRRQLAVDQRFELIDDPLHHLLAAPLDRAKCIILKCVGAVFDQSAVSFVVAFDADDDERDLVSIQIVFESPGFAIGRGFILKQIVSVSTYR